MPGAVHVLSSDPLILTIDDFVTEEEARYLIVAGNRAMKPSTIVCDKPEGCVDPRRSSQSAQLGEDRLAEPIRQRAREFSGLRTCETIQIVRYTVGQEFKPHLDAFDASTKAGQREIRSGGGQRAATFLVYLNEPEAGGATVFPKVGLSVLPKACMAVYWRHQVPGTTRVDDRMLHGGAPVTSGTKYACNIWLRQPLIAMTGTQLNPQLSPRR